MTRRRWLATDVGKNVVRRLAALAERHHDHGSKRLAAGRIGNRGVIARGIDPRPAGHPAERVARDASALQLERQRPNQRIGPDADGCDDAAGLDSRAVGQYDRARRGFLDADAEPKLDATTTHPIDN